jgi:hypothetical protein
MSNRHEFGPHAKEDSMLDRRLRSFRGQAEMVRALCPGYAEIAGRLGPLWASVEVRLRDALVDRFGRGVSVQRVDGVIVASLVGVDLELHIGILGRRLDAQVVSARRRRGLSAIHSVDRTLDRVGEAVRQVVGLVALEKSRLAPGEPTLPATGAD